MRHSPRPVGGKALGGIFRTSRDHPWTSPTRRSPAALRSDGTVAVDMDPLSLLCRLASAVPPPRFHTVRYAGVLAPASKMRPRIVPKPPVTPANDLEPTLEPSRGGSRYRPWAEFLKRCFSID